MAKADNFDPTTVQREQMLKSVRVEELYTGTKINKKDITYRKRNLRVLAAQSQFDPCASLWAGLSEAAKTRWDNAGAVCGLTGWELFFQDTTYRLLNNLPGLASPSVLHQYKVLKWIIDDQVQAHSINQVHWRNRYNRNRIPGSKKAYIWEVVEEFFAPPLTIEFNYHADLEAKDAGSYFKACVFGNGYVGGVPTYFGACYDLDLVTGWKQFSQAYSPAVDTIYYYYLALYANRLEGIACFDNFNFEHDAQNWAFDPFCDNVKDKYAKDGYGYRKAFEPSTYQDISKFDSAYL